MNIDGLLATITLSSMALIFLYWAVYEVLDYKFEFSETKKHIPIKFKSFVALYNLKPASWTLYDNFICYRRSVFRQSPFGCGHHDIETTEFKFSFPDLLKYRRWKKRLEKNEKAMKDAKEFQFVVEDIRAEIEKVKRQNEEMMKRELEKLQRRGETEWAD